MKYSSRGTLLNFLPRLARLQSSIVRGPKVLLCEIFKPVAIQLTKHINHSIYIKFISDLVGVLTELRTL